VSYLLGVDGGNTKTVALVADLDGRILGAGRAGCADIYAAGEGAFTALATAINAALQAAGLRAEQLAVGVFSMAGADWPEDFALLQNTLQQRGFGRKIIVVNDALGALRAGSPDGYGVSVVCGTGIATGARSPDGRFWHSSFWQEMNGAGFLGHEVLRSVYRAELGIDPPTALTAQVLAHYGLASVEQLLHGFTARQPQRPGSIASLARVLLDAAQAGDATACRLVQQHGTTMGEYVLVAARKVGLNALPFHLVLAGGVFRHDCNLLIEAVLAHIRAGAPAVRPRHSPFEPVVGALLLAFDALELPVDAARLAYIAATLPEAELFLT
jgi:N-acetylglucosamine kinase-like BadF-type ATPase